MDFIQVGYCLWRCKFIAVILFFSLSVPSNYNKDMRDKIQYPKPMATKDSN